MVKSTRGPRLPDLNIEDTAKGGVCAAELHDCRVALSKRREHEVAVERVKRGLRSPELIEKTFYAPPVLRLHWTLARDASARHSQVVFGPSVQCPPIH